MPGWLTWRLPPLCTVIVHVPSTFSPQKCTDRNGQSSKLELTTSLGRSNSSVDVVPSGDVRSMRRLPRGKNRSEILHCTCSANRTSFRLPTHPPTSMVTVIVLPGVGSICLLTLLKHIILYDREACANLNSIYINKSNYLVFSELTIIDVCVYDEK